MTTMPPTWPGYPPGPAPQPAGQPPRRRWGRLAAAAAGGAVIAAAAATVIAIAATPNRAPTPGPAPAPVTVTATPTTPAPLPAAQADAKTCSAYRSIVAPASAAIQQTLKPLPTGVTITSPEVAANPDWSAAVDRAATQFQQASDQLAAQIAPGTSPMLGHFANIMVSALKTMSVAYQTRDPDNGDDYNVYHSTDQTLSAMCH